MIVHGEYNFVDPIDGISLSTTIYPPESDNILWEKHNAIEGSFGFTSEAYGEFRFCFQYKTINSKKVFNCPTFLY